MKNWKTTIGGIVAAVLSLNVNGMTVKSFLLAAGIAALGMLSKDHNVTGGTVQQ